jgi:hypothetical protein
VKKDITIKGTKDCTLSVRGQEIPLVVTTMGTQLGDFNEYVDMYGHVIRTEHILVHSQAGPSKERALAGPQIDHMERKNSFFTAYLLPEIKNTKDTDFVFTTKYENGKTYRKETMRNEEIEGVVKEYAEDGKLLFTQEMKDGKPWGRKIETNSEGDETTTYYWEGKKVEWAIWAWKKNLEDVINGNVKDVINRILPFKKYAA